MRRQSLSPSPPPPPLLFVGGGWDEGRGAGGWRKAERGEGGRRGGERGGEGKEGAHVPCCLFLLCVSCRVFVSFATCVLFVFLLSLFGGFGLFSPFFQFTRAPPPSRPFCVFVVRPHPPLLRMPPCYCRLTKPSLPMPQGDL